MIGNKWIDNNMVLNLTYPDIIFTTFLYLVVIFSVVVVAHGYLIHFRSFKRIRICTDVAAITTAVQAICYIQCDENCGRQKSVLLLNILSVSFCGALCQICDNYIVYNRYVLISSRPISPLYHRFVFLYVFVLMYLCWWPFYNIIPLFLNLNTPEATSYLTIIISYIYFTAYSSYEVYFTALVIIRLNEINKNGSSSRNYVIQSICSRAIKHNIVSIAGLAAYCFWQPYGIVVYNLGVVLSLHLFFNPPAGGGEEESTASIVHLSFFHHALSKESSSAGGWRPGRSPVAEACKFSVDAERA